MEAHGGTGLENEMLTLRAEIAALGGLAEEQLASSLQALRQHDETLAQKVAQAAKGR